MTHTDRIARILVELDGTNPQVWRRVEVPLTTNLKALHGVIQAAMPFDDCHLFRFDVGDKRYGIPNPEWDDVLQIFDAMHIKLGVLIARGISQFSYIYDFGDHWQHMVTIETTAVADPAVSYPRCVDGAGRAPPEDVGGIPGFGEFLDAMENPRHPDHQRLVQWYGTKFDPDKIDLPTIEARIAILAARRARGKAAQRKAL